MPFVSNMDDEEEQKQNPGGVSPVGGGAVHLAPSAGVGSAGPGGSGAAPEKGAGGQFATLDKYITANQGQAEPLAGKITGAIGDQYKGLDAANQGVLQGIQGQVTNAPGYTKGDNDLIAQESASPVSFAGDANNVSAFQKQLTNSYGGPNSAEGTSEYQKQQADLNNAISQGNAKTQTAAGRTQLIGENTKKPTTGAVALNSAILSQDPNYLGQVESAYKPFQNLVTGLGSGASDINKTIASEKADAASSSKAARDTITGQMTGLNTAVNNQLTAAQQNAAAKNATVKQDLASGKVSPDDLKTLGISQEQWDSLSGAQKAAATSQLVSSADNKFQANSGTANIDPTSWLSQVDPNVAFNAGNTATADQYSQAGAFQSLLKGLNLDTPTLAINPANSAQAGTAPKSLNTFDYNSALQNTNDTATAEKAAAQAYVDALQSGADEEHAQMAAQKKLQENQAQGATTILNSTVGLPVSGAVGAGKSVANQVQGAVSKPVSLSNVANIATGGAYGASKAVVSGLANAVSTVTNIFCFHPWTLIEMADGTLQSIWRIQVGDLTRGGKVLATTRGVGTEFYWYNGVLVTGKHAVKEDGTWVRVENSKQGRKFSFLTEVVCNLTTESHRIWANGNEFADERETDQYEHLNLDDSLAEMNRLG